MKTNPLTGDITLNQTETSWLFKASLLLHAMNEDEAKQAVDRVRERLRVRNAPADPVGDCDDR